MESTRAEGLEIGRSEARKPAVDGDDLPGDVARVVAQQEHHGRGDLPRRALAPERNGRAAAARAGRRWPGGRAACRSIRAPRRWHEHRAAILRARRGGTGRRAPPSTCRTPGCGCPGFSPAIDETSTIAPPSVMRGSAARHARKCDAHVDREHRVPLGHRRSLEPATLADADVAHQPVDPAERVDRLVDHARARCFVGDVADHDRRPCPPASSTSRAVSCAASGVAIDAGDRRAFARREHRDRAAVADRRVGIVRTPRAGADTTTRRSRQRPGAASHPDRDGQRRRAATEHLAPLDVGEIRPPPAALGPSTNTTRTASSSVMRASAAPRQ